MSVHDEFPLWYTNDRDVYFHHVVSCHGYYILMEREKGKKWDGLSRISSDQYKNNWNDIFKTKKETKKSSEPKTRMEQMEQLTHDPIVD